MSNPLKDDDILEAINDPMSSELDRMDDDILEATNNPMSSELDHMDTSDEDDGLAGSADSFIDDSDEDPDFMPSGDSRSESDNEDDVGVVMLAASNANSVNVSDDGVEPTIVDDNVSVNDHDSLEGDVNISLSEKFKKLKTKNERDTMKKEEEDKWSQFEGKQQTFQFSGNPRYFFNLPITARPVEYYKKYLTDEFLDLMVTETNRNAAQVISKTRLNRSSRLRKWRPTNRDEMEKFIGLLLYMGLVSLPRISDYWSTKALYKNHCASKVMGRNRFQLLMRFWHFNNNDTLERDGRLGKISPLLTHLNDIFKTMKSPGKEIVVDESMVPFRGRLVFRQYLPLKTHKYGVKIFKLCDVSGYTFGMIVYMGKGTGTNDGMTLATSVVMDLMAEYLDKGHVLFLDNFYTSVDLANGLLQRSTHTVGTVTSNRAWFPHSKMGNGDNKALNKGEMVCLEYPTGIVFTKWMDKREVRIMSTTHPLDYVDTGKKTRQGDPIVKPLVVVEYNKAKIGIDLSDQMSSYSTSVRKTIRWYHKVAEELLLGTAMVNSWLAYKENVGGNNGRRGKNKYCITTFKENIVYAMLGLSDDPVEEVKVTGHHYLSESNVFVGEGRNRRRSRKVCKVCYDRVSNSEGRSKAKNLKKVFTFCEQCPNKPYICKKCFKDIHK